MASNNSRGVYLLVIDEVTDNYGATYKTATIYAHAEVYGDICHFLDKCHNRQTVQVHPTLADAKARAETEGATRYPVRVIQAGQL